MPLIKPTIVIDLLNTFWLTVIFVVLFCLLPTKISSLELEQSDKSHQMFDRDRDLFDMGISPIVGCYLRIVLSAILGVLALSYLHLLNWFTLILLYGACLFVNYLESCDWEFKKSQEKLQTKMFNLVDILDRGLSLGELIRALYNKFQLIKSSFSSYLKCLMDRQGIAFTIFLAVILGSALLLRWEYPLVELRFSYPNHYNHLLLTQQIVAGKYPATNSLPVFPALTAVLSILGSIEPMQTIRFLSPILGILTVLSVGYLINVLNKNAFSALVAMFALGIYLFTWEQIINPELPNWIVKIVDSLNSSLVRQWTGSELEIGIISLLLGLGYFFDRDKSQQQTNTFKINIICSLILVAMSAPSLLILVGIAPIGILGGKKLALIGITAAWIILAIFAAMTQSELIWTQSFLSSLPIALSLLAGFLFSAIAEAGKVLSEKWAETFCLALVLALSCNFLLPSIPKLTYVEYDIAARKSLEIKNLMPRNTWTLAAPTEQLAQIYGSGWYEDLALFVEKYQDKVQDPKFDFPVGDTDLFVFVEKIPFVTFPNEPDSLPDQVLGDRTYRYYRSTAGRSSLEFEALQMCEAYRKNHPNSKIYYENNELRIYHFKVKG